MNEVDEKEHELMAKAEVSLILDSYNEIFSDFDPRPDSQRALSVDFLDEAKRATREIKPGVFELRFLIPAALRRLDKEAVIKKRLKDHFKKHHEMLEKERAGVVKKGSLFLVFGFVFMILGAFVLAYYHGISLFKEILVVIFQPAGWFFFWEGLDLIIFSSKEKSSDLEFYRKMTTADFVFTHY
ncbi:MAG: hypothetical protein MUF61_02050 [archaeon]|jgi:hypothetical protein|nr:hypothetical protein [archaeon]